MSSNIYQLLYLSSSAQKMDEQELLGLLEKSRKSNEKRGITGFLLYNDGNIIQLLEGEKEDVENLYLKIARDIRHDGLIRLFQAFTEKRDFPDWSMGFSSISKPDCDGKIEGLNNLMNRQNPPRAELDKISTKVRIFIDSFRMTNELTRDT